MSLYACVYCQSLSDQSSPYPLSLCFCQKRGRTHNLRLTSIKEECALNPEEKSCFKLCIIS